MQLGKITVITPPDKLFNSNISYLLVKPSNFVKQQFQTILSHCMDDLNVFIYDADDLDTGWMLSVSQQADVIIVDIDNCDTVTKQFVTFLLAAPNVHYITSDETTPYNLISKNRIFNLDGLIDQLKSMSGEDDDDEDGSTEE